jgi:hypothetical protein
VGAFVYAFSKSLHEFLKSPHAVIAPLALRAAKALALEYAGYAVDGNTDGEFLNSSTTSTKDEQGAWWQVDLGGTLFKDQRP